ncbi:MAG: anti-sigma factor RsbA family regulatory protein [Acidimicrobiia bacterium]
MTTSTSPHQSEDTFRHEALLYSGRDEFVARTSDFIRASGRAGEPILVVVSAEKIRLLRSALGEDADAVLFADMVEMGQNPARIIPAWRSFVEDHAGAGRRFRGIGEPIWASRRPEELIESQHHETLLNVAFGDAPAWWLLCPYDTASLAPDVIEEAHRSHRFIWGAAGHQPSGGCGRPITAPFDGPLPEPPMASAEVAFNAGSLGLLRDVVSGHAAIAGLAGNETAALVLAVNEVATNSIRHGGGRGTMRVWRDTDTLVCEVRDQGHIRRPLAGRERPADDQESGRGLWLVNQLCDLVQIRTSAAGTTVRLHMRRSR